MLVGFMGSGKSTVGPLLARAVGWEFQDSDRVVESVSGLGIAEIFARLGEAEFRALEERAMRDLLGRSRVVVATGGGWAAQPGALDGARRGTLTVWLKVGVEEAVARVVRTGVGRPLLEGPDPVLSAGALLAERVPYYAKSDLAYDTESMSPHEIVEQIVETLRSH